VVYEKENGKVFNVHGIRSRTQAKRQLEGNIQGTIMVAAISS